MSLPYHNPLMAANRIIQLDHQTRGRVMFGVGPGLLPSDAFSMGIEPATQRDRMVESIEVILRLWKGERVTHKIRLVQSRRRDVPAAALYLAASGNRVASSVTPSGGKLAGRHGFGMLCVAATQAGGYDALGVNWEVANETAAEHGRTMDPEKLRLVGPVHIAETREQAFENCKFGFEKWRDYFSGISGGRRPRDDREPSARNRWSRKASPWSARRTTPSRRSSRLQKKQGEFGCFLQLAHNWANFENTKKSYDLWQRHVTPAINGANTARETALDWAQGQQGTLHRRRHRRRDADDPEASRGRSQEGRQSRGVGAARFRSPSSFDKLRMREIGHRQAEASMTLPHSLTLSLSKGEGFADGKTLPCVACAARQE